MAAIGNIRKHYGLLVAIVGIALLAFVLGDLLNSTTRRGTATEVAVVNGEKITYQDYSNLVNVNLENAKMQTGGTLSANDNYAVHANTLEQMIRDIIMKEEYKDLGLVVTAEELRDQFLGEKPNQYVLQSFSDANGNLNRELITTYIRDFQTLNPEMQAAWLNFERAIKEDRLNTKYENLLRKGFYLPNKLAARYYSDKNDKTSAEVYAIRYNTIADSTVVITDADNKAYYEANKQKYQTDETRSIDYVIFDVKPSQADIEFSKKYVSELIEDFKTTHNDINFVNANSDLAYDSTWKTRKDVPVELEKVIFDDNNEIGFVYGPYENEGYYNIAKIIDIDNTGEEPKARIAVVAHEITASTNTYQNVFAEVNRFVTENTTAEEFNAAIEEQGLNKRTFPTLRKSSSNITGLSNPRQIVRWAFDDNTKVGDISTVFDLDDMYVVALLTKEVEEGYLPSEDIAERYNYIIKKEKKGNMLAEQAKAYGTDYQKMIDNMKGEKTTVENVTFEGRGFGNFGVEDKVIGTVVSMKEGETSEPIIGGNGLYVVKVTKQEKAAAPADYASIEREKRSQFNNQILNQGAYSALKDNVKIEDNSVLFY